LKATHWEEDSVWAGNVRRSVDVECHTLRGEQYVGRKCEENSMWAGEM